jgi:hemoglobin-like flavoprotein
MTLNVALIARTFERAKTENGGLKPLGLRFYQRLFEKYPAVQPLFKTPPEAQHQKLMASIAAIVASVTQPEKMLPYLMAMGIRHIAYGTENAHYAAVQENLIAVLREHLSVEGEWTDEMSQQWHLALETISQVMMDAANTPAGCETQLRQAGYLPNGFKLTPGNPWEMQAV